MNYLKSFFIAGICVSLTNWPISANAADSSSVTRPIVTLPKVVTILGRGRAGVDITGVPALGWGDRELTTTVPGSTTCPPNSTMQPEVLLAYPLEANLGQTQAANDANPIITYQVTVNTARGSPPGVYVNNGFYTIYISHFWIQHLNSTGYATNMNNGKWTGGQAEWTLYCIPN